MVGRVVRACVAFGVFAALLMATRPAVAAHPPGLSGNPFLLTSTTQFDGYDVAAAPDGTAYIGWIDTTGGHRVVNLCTLPTSASTCTGGIQTVPALDDANAHDLHVLRRSNGTVLLVWIHNATVGSDQVGEIAEASAPNGLHLSAGTDVASAPAYADLPDAQLGPDGSVWTVVYAGLPAKQLIVRPGYTQAPTTVHTGFDVGQAQLAFGEHPVLTAEVYGAITKPVYYATESSKAVWSGFTAVPKTWAVGTDAVLKSTRRGLRLITATNNSSYRPVISSWTGSAFGTPHLTADSNACAPSTHDGSTDPSGRLLDVSWECGKVTVADYVDDSHPAIVRFADKNTSTFAPQIASGTRGVATIAYTDETSGTGAIDHLRIARVRVPDTTHTVTRKVGAGSISVTAPSSCLPAVQVSVGVKGHPAGGWRVASHSLTLGGTAVSGGHVDGAALTAAHNYTLTGTVVFAKGTTRTTATESVPFTTC